MQGTARFDFANGDEPLIAELAALAAKGIARQPETIAAALEAAGPGRR